LVVASNDNSGKWSGYAVAVWAQQKIVELMELIAVYGVGGEPGKVVEQVHRFFDEVSICSPQPGIIGLPQIWWKT
jgi:hypothetical protein